MVEITYQIVLSTLQTIALIVGIVYYITIMRNQQRAQQKTDAARNSQILIQLYNRMSDVDVVERWLDLLSTEFDLEELKQNNKLQAQFYASGS